MRRGGGGRTEAVNGVLGSTLRTLQSMGLLRPGLQASTAHMVTIRQLQRLVKNVVADEHTASWSSSAGSSH